MFLICVGLILHLITGLTGMVHCLFQTMLFLTRSNPCKYGEEGKYGAIGATSRGKSNPQLLLD